MKANISISHAIRQSTTPPQYDSLVSKAQDLAQEIYNIKGWRFPIDKLCVDLRQAVARKSVNAKQTYWFAITAINGETPVSNPQKFQIIVNQGGTRALDYGGFLRLTRALRNGKLHKVIK